MRIVETTPDRLILEDRPWFLAGFVCFMGTACLWAVLSGQTDGPAETTLVAVLGIGALAIAHHFFPFQRLTFDRNSEQFIRVVARITGRRFSAVPLSEIEHAAVEAQWGESSRMERLTLVRNGEMQPLEFGFVGTSRGKLADAINTWLSEPGRPAH